MKYQIKINSATTVEESNDYWTNNDYVQLLGKYNYPDGENTPGENLKELLLMAITDFEPNEAAAILLEYKLNDQLNEGQIHQISNDMLLDKISEEYPEIHLHEPLFHINQLLYKAYNGKFPNTKATIIECSLSPADKSESEENELTKEGILKLLVVGLAGSNIIKRLFSESIEGNKAFPEAESILWQAKTADHENYTLITSDYWLSKDDLISESFEASFEKVEVTEEL